MKTTTIISTLVSLVVLVLAIIVLVNKEKKEKYNKLKFKSNVCNVLAPKHTRIDCPTNDPNKCIDMNCCWDLEASQCYKKTDTCNVYIKGNCPGDLTPSNPAFSKALLNLKNNWAYPMVEKVYAPKLSAKGNITTKIADRWLTNLIKTYGFDNVINIPNRETGKGLFTLNDQEMRNIMAYLKEAGEYYNVPIPKDYTLVHATTIPGKVDGCIGMNDGSGGILLEGKCGCSSFGGIPNFLVQCPDDCCINYRGGFPLVSCQDQNYCSGRGPCDLAKGICKCDPIYTNLDCSSCTQPNRYGPNCGNIQCSNCSGHGTCSINTGKCTCDPGWTGSNCGSSISVFKLRKRMAEILLGKKGVDQVFNACPRIAQMEAELFYNLINHAVTKQKKDPTANLASVSKNYKNCF
jgi:hypothetical protein